MSRSIREGKIAKRLSSALEFLKNEYKKSSSAWLTDNFYLFVKEGRKALKQLKNIKKEPKRLFSQINSGLDIEKSSVTYEQIDSILKNSSYTSVELSSLEWVLRAVIIMSAADMVKSGKELKNAVLSLAHIDEIDFDLLCENNNAVEKIFLSDPAGIYPKMDRASRGSYRALTAMTAQFRGTSELNVANELLERAKNGETECERHIGYPLLRENEMLNKRKTRALIHLFFMYFLPAVLSVAVCAVISNFWFTFPIFIVLIEGLRPFISLFAPKMSPIPLPKMDLGGTVPEEMRTAVVISELLPAADKMNKLGEKLERLKLTNSDGAVMFGISADFKSAKVPVKPEDKSALKAAEKEINRLNKKYGGGFFMVVRKRTYNKSEGEYIGYERKRGAISELAGFIKGGENKYALLAGDENAMHSIKYIIALDSDTVLHTGGVYDLVAAAAHPLNRPIIKDSKTVGGYGIIVPSIGVDLLSSGKTCFSRLMSGVRGVCPYGGMRNDFLNDAFGTGAFSGKGIIDVDAYWHVAAKAFPENLILSHDIPEGALMHTGFASDAEITDSVPSTASAWLLRQHRWIRGDWQNLRLIFDKRFSGVDRYRMADNLRRSLTEPFAMLNIIASLFFVPYKSVLLLLCSLLGVCAPWLTAALVSAVHGGRDLISRRYYSNVMSDVRSGSARSLMSLIILPAWSLMSADAIVRSLWRQFVSHDKLLEWTTASDSDSIKAFKYPSACAAAGVVTAALSPIWLGKLVGLSFVCGIMAFTVLSKQKKDGENSMDSSTKEQIVSWAAAHWKYYEKYCTAENNYLPPDNVQYTPVARVAARTSPTNIGLYMLSALSAYDFGFIDRDELVSMLENTLSTVEKLPKWHGNLYNWYDTQKLVILKPVYVSSVDSGNFAVSMTALAQGLREKGLNNLYKRVQKLADDIDLSPLFNEKKKLFHIGYDAEKEKLSDSYYDLLMSEARAMSYYACARRQVSHKHWGALGRTLAVSNGHIGAVSWTGTMFEYYMPQLFLPALEGSLEYESLKFAFTNQVKRAELWRVPWGISESGFFAFDNELNYLYKAHGVQKLGLKRGLDDDIVISPYSSFLLMKFETERAVENLRWLEKMGMTGECGFYEAADYTPSRRGMHDFAVVRSYMAHHVGMSIIACANAVFNNITVRRFMSDARMAASEWMLEERIPVGAIVFDDFADREVPERPHKVVRKVERTEPINLQRPDVRLFSNGSITLAAADSGVTLSMAAGRDVFVRTTDILRKPCGLFAVIKTGNTVFSVTPAPFYEKKAVYNTEVAPDYIAYYGEADSIEGMMKASVHPFLPCETRSIIIKNNGKITKKVSLALYTEPILEQFSSYNAHIAFSKLFVTASIDEQNNTVFYERRSRDGKSSVFLAMAFSRKMKFAASRENVLDRPDGIRSLKRVFDKNPERTSGVPDCCMAATDDFALQSGEEYELTVKIAVADSYDEVLDILAKARELTSKCGAYSPFAEGVEHIIAPQILSRVLFGAVSERTNFDIKPAEINELWRSGISGDYPIILAELSENENSERVEILLNIHKKLHSAGIKTDLVFVIRDGGEYDRPQLSCVRRKMSELSYELMLDANAGVHIADSSVLGDEYIEFLKFASCCVIPDNMKPETENGDFTPMEIYKCTPSEAENAKGFKINKKPELPWCLALANETFGTLVSDSSLGFTWAGNSRENKLTPWSNDTRTDNDGELLLLRVNGKVYNMLSGATAVFTPECAKYYGKIENIQFMVTVTVPEKGCIKYVDVNFGKNKCKGIELAYYTEPVLAVDRSRKHMLKTEKSGKSLFVTNVLRNEFGGFMMLKSSENSEFTCSRAAFMQGDWSEQVLAQGDICAASIVKLNNFIESVSFSLSWAVSQEAAQKLSELKLSPLILKTPEMNSSDAGLNDFYSTWLPYQILKVRIFARTGFYQCGGAWGFRDQLQDACAALYFRPDITRRQILRCAAHQFLQGDVLHWWHMSPRGAKGVRTRCSDDYLWLVYAVCEYIHMTGDRDILNCQVPYLEADALAPDEHERYIAPARTKEKESIQKHCERALEYSMKFGSHGLLLMGNGDWNDGMNLVGAEGKGESVWLSMFAAILAKRFSKYSSNPSRYIEYAEKLLEAVDLNAWDVEWYKRAFFDDGRPLGSNENTECRIDSLPQSFCIFAQMKDEQRKKSAMESAERLLVDKKNGIIRLFYPPFNNDKTVGYIAGYGPGIRENGGQYTHAAVWLAMAAVQSGYADGKGMLEMLLPFNHDNKVYKGEPYVTAADIYTHPELTGRAGWTQYTGSAGWLYTALTDNKNLFEEHNE